MMKSLRDIKQDSFGANIFLLVLFPYSFFTSLSQMQGIHIIYPAFAMSVLIYVFISATCRDKALYKMYLRLVAIVLLFLLLNMFLIGNTDIKNVVYGAFIMPSLGALLFFYRINKWVALALFLGVALFFGFYIIENGPFVNEETDLLVNSRNYVSYFVVLYSLPYFIHCYDYDKTPSLIFPAICVVISVFAFGRTGILVSFALLAGVIYLKMSQKGKARIIYRILFFALIIIIFFIGISGDFIDMYFSRFSEEGINTAGRSESWAEYSLTMLNPINLMLGTPIDSLQYTKNYLNGSLHNSYFTLHAREGIVGLFLVVYMFKGAWQLYKHKCALVLLIMVALLLKGFTDADMGGTYSGGDIYVFYLTLVYFFKKKDKIHERKSVSVVPASVPSNSGE